MKNYKQHFPIGVNGQKWVFKEQNAGDYLLASYSTRMSQAEILLFPCDALGNVSKWVELYGEVGDLCPADIHKVVARYNSGRCW